MFEKISDFFKKWSETGLYLPMANDATTGKASVTLLFAYGSFLLATGAVVYLLTTDPLQGAGAAICMSIVYNILYKMRQVDKFKFSLEEKSLELEDTPDEETTSKKEDK